MDRQMFFLFFFDDERKTFLEGQKFIQMLTLLK